MQAGLPGCRTGRRALTRSHLTRMANHRNHHHARTTRPMTSFFRRCSPTRLDRGPPAFFLKPGCPGATRWLGWLPPPGRRRRSPNEVAEFIEAILPVPFLIPKALGIQQQVPCGGDPPPLLHTKSGFDVGRQARAAGHVPAQYGLGSNLVDILPARTTGTNKGPFQFAMGDTDFISNFQHGYGHECTAL